MIHLLGPRPPVRTRPDSQPPLIRIIGRAMDTIMAFPLFVLAMGIVAALGNSVLNIIIATMIINLPFYCRFARSAG